MTMQMTRYEFLVRAVQPISHTQENFGNYGVFMRKRIVMPNGSVQSVPYITGDSIRNRARRASTYALLDAAGLLGNEALTESALKLMFAGGGVTEKGDASVVNLDKYRELASLIPTLALFGGCTDNRPLPGQINIDEGNPICSETMHTAPGWVHEWLSNNGVQVLTQRRLIEEVTRVRMDPTTSPEMVKLLTPTEQIRVNGRLLASEKAHEDGDAIEAKKNKSSAMPRSFERLIEGTLFLCGIEARTYTDLEADTFDYCVGCLLNNFTVGGKQSVGHGRLKFVCGNKIHFTPTSGNFDDMGTGLAAKTGELFKAHVAAHKEQIVSWLEKCA